MCAIPSPTPLRSTFFWPIAHISNSILVFIVRTRAHHGHNTTEGTDKFCTRARTLRQDVLLASYICSRYLPAAFIPTIPT